MSRRLPIEQALLGFLIQKPMHGYDLHQQAKAELGDIWYMGISNIYGALKRLEKNAWVESTLVPQESHPSRKVYQITPDGERSFLDWLHTPIITMRKTRVEFPTKLYFFRTLGLEGVDDLIATQETFCQNQVERLKQKAAQRDPHDLVRLTFDFRRCQIKAIITWLHECRGKI